MTYLALMKEELGRSLVAAGPVPVWRVVSAERHRTPAGAPRDRHLFGGLPPCQQLNAKGDSAMTVSEIFETMDYGTAP